MKIFVFLTLGLLTVHGMLSAQETPMPATDTLGSPVSVTADPRVDELLRKQVAENKEKGTIPGYRVQVFFGSGNQAHTKANQVKSEIMVKHPELAVYVQWDSPNFRVRVGNCRNRFEAEKLRQEIIETFPAGFIVKDDIDPPVIPGR